MDLAADVDRAGDEEAEADIVPSSQMYARMRPDPDGLAKTVELLAQAQNPLMLVGDRVAQSQAVQEAVKVAELLGLPEGIVAVEMTPLGYPDEEPPAPRRREPAEVIFYESFGQGRAG